MSLGFMVAILFLTMRSILLLPKSDPVTFLSEEMSVTITSKVHEDFVLF